MLTFSVESDYRLTDACDRVVTRLQSKI